MIAALLNYCISLVRYIQLTEEMNSYVLKRESDSNTLMHYILDLSEQIILHTVVNLYEIDGEDVCTCFQDLPEHFEDNIKTWMDNFLQLLSADNKLLKTEVCIVQQECCCNFLRACLYI